MQLYEIWSEGYVVTGNSATAHHHGSMEAETFEEACKKFFTSEEDRKYFNHH